MPEVSHLIRLLNYNKKWGVISNSNATSFSFSPSESIIYIRGGEPITITGHMNSALSLAGHKINSFYTKVLPLCNNEED